MPGLRESLPGSALVAALSDGLVSDYWHTRRSCISTLGTLYLPEAARLLEAVFPRYLGEDPLLLSVLLRELHWLSEDRPRAWEYVKTAARAPLYLARWAALEAVYHLAQMAGRGRAQRLYRPLLRRPSIRS